MSMQSWSVTGIGFFLYTGDNFRDVLEFLVKHENSVRQVISSEREREDLLNSARTLLETNEDIKDFYELQGADENELPGIIAAVMNHEQDVYGFEGNPSCGDTDAEASVLFCRSYAWEMTERERTLVREDVERIIAEYAAELGVDPRKIDDQDIEYYG